MELVEVGVWMCWFAIGCLAVGLPVISVKLIEKL